MGSQSIIRLALLAALVSGCATQPYVKVSPSLMRVNGDTGFALCGEFGQEFGRDSRNTVAVEHCSNPGRGYPFNERFDWSVDTLSYSRKFWGKAR